MTHSPGPWFVEGTSVYSLDETGSVNRFYAGLQGGYAVAGTRAVKGDKTSPEEMAANARLISAAPDLLASLQEALHGLAHNQITEKGVARYQRALDAIAKATATAA